MLHSICLSSPSTLLPLHTLNWNATTSTRQEGRTEGQASRQQADLTDWMIRNAAFQILFFFLFPFLFFLLWLLLLLLFGRPPAMLLLFFQRAVYLLGKECLFLSIGSKLFDSSVHLSVCHPTRPVVRRSSCAARCCRPSSSGCSILIRFAFAYSTSIFQV